MMAQICVGVSHSPCEAGGRAGCRHGGRMWRGNAPPPMRPAGRAPWSSPPMLPVCAHDPGAAPPAGRSYATSRNTTRPPPPAAAERGHRFPRSHGPSEQKVNEQWLTFRCHETPAPGSAPAGPRPASRTPKEPESRRNPGESASAGPPRCARRARTPANPSTRCQPSRPVRSDADRTTEGTRGPQES
jgi:hypothetical protein